MDLDMYHTLENKILDEANFEKEVSLYHSSW